MLFVVAPFLAYSIYGQVLQGNFNAKLEPFGPLTTMCVTDYGLLSAHDDHIVRLWSLETGQVSAIIHNLHTDSINSIVSASGILYSGSDDQTVQLWDLSRNLLLGTLQPGVEVFVLAIVPGNGDLVVGLKSGKISIFRGTDHLRSLYFHTSWVYSLLAIDMMLYSTSYDLRICRWDLESNSTQPAYVGSTGQHWVRLFKWNTSSIIAAANSQSLGTVWVYDRTPSLVQTYDQKPDVSMINTLSFMPDDTAIATTNGGVFIWNMTNLAAVPQNAWTTAPLGPGASLGPDFYFYDSNNHMFKYRNRQMIWQSATFISSTLYVTELYIFVAGERGMVYQCTLAGKFVKNFEVVQSAINDLVVYEDLIIVACADSMTRAIDVNTGSLVQTFEGHTGSVDVLALSQNKLFTGSQDRTVMIWDLRTAMLERTFRLSQPVNSIVVHFHFMFVSADMIYKYNLNSGQQIGIMDSYNLLNIQDQRTYTAYCNTFGSETRSRIDIGEPERFMLSFYIQIDYECITSLLVYGNETFVGMRSGQIWRYSTTSLRKIETLLSRTSAVRDLHIQANQLFALTEDGVVSVWQFNQLIPFVEPTPKSWITSATVTLSHSISTTISALTRRQLAVSKMSSRPSSTSVDDDLDPDDLTQQKTGENNLGIVVLVVCASLVAVTSFFAAFWVQKDRFRRNDTRQLRHSSKSTLLRAQSTDIIQGSSNRGSQLLSGSKASTPSSPTSPDLFDERRSRSASNASSRKSESEGQRSRSHSTSRSASNVSSRKSESEQQKSRSQSNASSKKTKPLLPSPLSLMEAPSRNKSELPISPVQAQTQTQVTQTTEISIPAFLEAIWGLDFKTNELLAEGGNGKIYLGAVINNGLAKRAGGNPIVIKMTGYALETMTDRTRVSFFQELSLSWRFRDHPNFVRIYAYSSRPVTLVMKYYALGDLDGFIQKKGLVTKEFTYSKLCLISLMRQVI